MAMGPIGRKPKAGTGRSKRRRAAPIGACPNKKGQAGQNQEVAEVVEPPIAILQEANEPQVATTAQSATTILFPPTATLNGAVVNCASTVCQEHAAVEESHPAIQRNDASSLPPPSSGASHNSLSSGAPTTTPLSRSRPSTTVASGSATSCDASFSPTTSSIDISGKASTAGITVGVPVVQDSKVSFQVEMSVDTFQSLVQGNHQQHADVLRSRIQNAFRNVTVNPETIEDKVNLDPTAFDMTTQGTRRSAVALRKAHSRARLLVVNVVKSIGSLKQQAYALHLAMMHPDMQQIAKAAGFYKTLRVKSILAKWRQLKDIVKVAATTQKIRSRKSGDQQAFIDTILTAVSPDEEHGALPLRESSKVLGLAVTTLHRQFKKTKSKRKAIKSGAADDRWIFKTKRKGHTKITSQLRNAIVTWVTQNENVIHSPIARDTLLVKLPGANSKRRVGKLLLEIPVRELHNQLVSPQSEGGLPSARDAEGEILVSDSTLRNIMKSDIPHLRRSSERYKQMCGCFVCINVTAMHKTFLSWRRRQERILKADTNNPQRHISYCASVKNADGTMKHPRPRDAIKDIMCPEHEELGFPHWKCVLRRCKNCPSLDLHEVETDASANAALIRFQVYQSFTKCSKHGVLKLNAKTCAVCEQDDESRKKKGKIRTRKHLTSLTRPIGEFVNEFYKPALEAYAFHLPHVRILSKNGCGDDRRAAFLRILGALLCGRDYAERLLSSMNGEVQHDHFGNDRDLSMEGSSVEMYKGDLLEAHEEGQISADEVATHLEFHSHFSDDSAQDASSTHANMDKLLRILKERVQSPIRKGTIIFDNTDGCAKQYRCWNAIYLLSLLASIHSVVVDRAIKAPGHGKDIVDGLNATDKRYLRELMLNVKAPEDDREKRMNATTMSEADLESFAEECARLCSMIDRESGVKGQSKHAKREAAAKMKCRTYHVTTKDDAIFSSICMGAAKNKSLDGKNNGLRARYNIRTDPDLGLGRAALRRVPCACQSCIDQMQLPWEIGTSPENQARFRPNQTCKLYPIFEGLNDWVIVNLVKTNKTDDDQIEAAHDIILDTIAEETRDEISIGNIGAFNTDDPEADGYYLVRWTSEPYELEQDEELTDYDPPMKLPAGELVCEGQYLNKVDRAKRWYTQSDGSTIIRLQQVLHSNVTLEEESIGTNPLPNISRQAKAEARRLGARRLTEKDHDMIMYEASKRHIIDHDEEMLLDEEESLDEESSGEEEGSISEEESDDENNKE